MLSCGPATEEATSDRFLEGAIQASGLRIECGRGNAWRDVGGIAWPRDRLVNIEACAESSAWARALVGSALFALMRLPALVFR